MDTVKAGNPMIDMIIPTDADMERAEVLGDLGEAAQTFSSAWQRVVAA